MKMLDFFLRARKILPKYTEIDKFLIYRSFWSYPCKMSCENPTFTHMAVKNENLKPLMSLSSESNQNQSSLPLKLYIL